MKRIHIILVSLFVLVVGVGILAMINKRSPDSILSTGTKKNNVEVTYFNKDEDYNWNKLKTQDLTVHDSTTITKDGIYHLTGNIENGNIIVNTTGVVKLIIEDMTIHNDHGSAIHIQSAKFCVIEFVGDNKLSDENHDGEDDAVIYSKDDLVLTGEGKVTIQANCNDGIVSKDDLKITGGNYEIVSQDDGIRGKDQLYITGGSFTINSIGDTLKSDNEEKGDIYIEDGTFDITTSTTSDNSAKGIKAYRSVIIDGGNFNVNSQDDSIHSNGDMTINGGNYLINTQDDAFHADSTMIINNGDINIESCYEGLEAEVITINNGDIRLQSSDDGINCASSDSNAMMGPGISEGCILTINGGNIYCNTSGDGLDSNGSIYINGGTIFIDGPENGDNSALDSDGECMINGGEVIALGAAGMLEMPSENSKCNVVVIPVNNASIITITSDKELLNIETIKNYQVLIYASSQLESGKEYEVQCDDTATSFTINSTITSVGNIMTGMHGGFNRPGEFMEGNKPENESQRPEGMEPPANGQMPQDGGRVEFPREGMQRPDGNFNPGFKPQV